MARGSPPQRGLLGRGPWRCPPPRHQTGFYWGGDPEGTLEVSPTAIPGRALLRRRPRGDPGNVPHHDPGQRSAGEGTQRGPWGCPPPPPRAGPCRGEDPEGTGTGSPEPSPRAGNPPSPLPAATHGPWASPGSPVPPAGRFGRAAGGGPAQPAGAEGSSAPPISGRAPCPAGLQARGAAASPAGPRL